MRLHRARTGMTHHALRMQDVTHFGLLFETVHEALLTRRTLGTTLTTTATTRALGAAPAMALGAAGTAATRALGAAPARTLGAAACRTTGTAPVTAACRNEPTSSVARTVGHRAVTDRTA